MALCKAVIKILYYHDGLAYYGIDIVEGILKGDMSKESYYVTNSKNRLKRILSMRYFNENVYEEFAFFTGTSLGIGIDIKRKFNIGDEISFFKQI